MKKLYILVLSFCSYSFLFAQGYTETLDTFYVPTPEYSISLGVDSLYFPSAITRPNNGTNFPMLILVHGTSALDKDANATKDFKDSVGAPSRKAKTKMLYEIADHLSKNGIMVLRYDKRSYTVNCIEEQACWWADTITPFDYIKDIHYAVEFAKTIPGVDTCNIFLAGHSQGGAFVSDVGNKRTDIRGVINLATTALPIDSVAVFQTITVDSDPSGASILRAQFDSLRAGLWPMNNTLYNQKFSPRFWLDWIQITDSAVITQQISNAATLIMYGTIDRFAPHYMHLPLFMNAIARTNVSYDTFPLLDHSFGTEYDSTMSVAALDTMVNWIHNNAFNCSPNPIVYQNIATTFIYPNPTTGILNIESSSPKLTIELFDITGKTLNYTNTANNRIDVSHLAAGLYFLRIDDGEKQLLYKVMKR